MYLSRRSPREMDAQGRPTAVGKIFLQGVHAHRYGVEEAQDNPRDT